MKQRKLSSLLLHHGVTVRIVVLFTMLLIVPYVFMIGLYFNHYHTSGIRSLGEVTEDTMVSVGTQITDHMRQQEEITMQVYYDDCVELLDEGREITQQDAQFLNKQLNSMRWSNSGIRSALIKRSEDGKVYGNAAFDKVVDLMEPYEEEIRDAAGKCLWYYTFDLGGRAKECKFVLARALNSRNNKNVGILYLVIDNYLITSPMRKLVSDSDRYLTDQDGYVIYSSEKSQIQTRIDVSRIDSKMMSSYVPPSSSTRDSLVAFKKIMDTGWLCISMVDIRNALYSSESFPVMIITLLVVYGILLLLMIFVLNRMIFKPLSYLKHSMDTYAENDLAPVQMKEAGVGEFASLSAHFNRMTERISSLMEAYRLETDEKNRQKMLALTAQMTPHFIYNALNTIKWMAVVNEQDNIRMLVESLIHIFMSAARVEDETYSLKDELELIENYAVIQKARFMNFDLVIEKDDACLDCSFKKLLLQPVVENAIIHGLGRGTIKDTDIIIRIWKDDDLHITVKDYGVGFDVEAWRLAQNNQVEDPAHTRIGLHNIEKIIELTYGSPYHIEINSTPGCGTVVEYLLPYRRCGKHDPDNHSR